MRFIAEFHDGFSERLLTARLEVESDVAELVADWSYPPPRVRDFRRLISVDTSSIDWTFEPILRMRPKYPTKFTMDDVGFSRLKIECDGVLQTREDPFDVSDEFAEEVKPLQMLMEWARNIVDAHLPRLWVDEKTKRREYRKNRRKSAKRKLAESQPTIDPTDPSAPPEDQ